MRMKYAAQTSVSGEVEAEIEQLLTKYGARVHFASGWQDLATIVVSMADRRIKFILPLPKKDARVHPLPNKGLRRSDADAYKAWSRPHGGAGGP